MMGRWNAEGRTRKAESSKEDSGGTRFLSIETDLSIPPRQPETTGLMTDPRSAARPDAPVEVGIETGASTPREADAPEVRSWVPAVVFVVLGLAGLVLVWWFVLPAPRLDDSRLDADIARGDYEAAQVLLDAQVARVPEDFRARYLLAELLLNRPDLGESVPRENAEDALAHLARLEGRDLPSIEPARVALYRGQALYQLDRWDEAEDALLEALRIDPAIPEAGWVLLNLYYLQGRTRDARLLALRLLETEPDPVDRAKFLLLELLRSDALRPDALSLVEPLERAVEGSPDALRPRIALGLARIRNGNVPEGLGVLEAAAEQAPESPFVMEGLLSGLEEAGRAEELVERFEALPADLKTSPRFARFSGLIAEGNSDWEAAIASDRLALEFDPANFAVGVRLGRALRFAGREAEAEALDRRIASYRVAEKGQRALFDEANAIPDLGSAPLPDLYERLAESRAATWHPAEAAAWRALIEAKNPPPSTP